MRREILIGKDIHTISVTYKPDGRFINMNDGHSISISSQKLKRNYYLFQTGNITTKAQVVIKGENIFVKAFGRLFSLAVLDPVEQAHENSQTNDLCAKAPMPGIVVEVHVNEGDIVVENQSLLTIESMKLLSVIRASDAAKVGTIYHQPGESFIKGATLVALHQIEEDNNA